MERTWTRLSLELKALSFQYFSVSPRWLAQWMNSEPKSSVLAVDEGAILDAVFENFNHPTPSGFERIMIEKALLWWMSICSPNYENYWASDVLHTFFNGPQLREAPAVIIVCQWKCLWWEKNRISCCCPNVSKLLRNELPDYEIKLSGLSVGVYIKMI